MARPVAWIFALLINEGATPGEGTELTLPAGDYWLLWRDASGARHVRGFAMRSGAETCVDTGAGDAPR